ncbi:TPA: Ig-like domain-containing protein, partial [Providencia alcalifaciens]
SFTYDISTAKVSTVTLNGDTQSKVANGTNAFTYTAHVVDGNGNPVTEAGVTVNWAQNKGTDVTLPATSTTNASGEATITLTSTTKAVADITVSAKVGTTAAVDADKTVSFMADRNNAVISIDSTNTKKLVPANGVTEYGLKISVFDLNNNPIADYPVKITNNDNELLTNSNGEIIYGFTSTVIGNNNVSVISVSDSLIKNSIIIRFSLPITILTSPF